MKEVIRILNLSLGGLLMGLAVWVNLAYIRAYRMVKDHRRRLLPAHVVAISASFLIAIVPNLLIPSRHIGLRISNLIAVTLGLVGLWYLLRYERARMLHLMTKTDWE